MPLQLTDTTFQKDIKKGKNTRRFLGTLVRALSDVNTYFRRT